MRKVRLCTVITGRDVRSLRRAAQQSDLFEVRIDMIGPGWREVAAAINKPWIAANRSLKEAGRWSKGEKARVKELLSAAELGADIVDIELNTVGLKDIVAQIKKKARCLISYHDWEGTPSVNSLAALVRKEIKAGADICKIVTTATRIEDNISVLEVIGMFPHADMVAFAMGAEGTLSRVLSPLAGAYFTYASIGKGKESAPGQVSADVMRRLLGTVK